jgi:sugar phosphate isomerase/epimerase
MIELKLALELSALGQAPAKALETAASLGVQGVEIEARGDFAPARLSQTGLRQLRKMLDDARLRVSAVRFRTRRGYYDAAELDARIKATKKAMHLAYGLGAGVVVNHVGRVPGADSAEWTLLREVLNDLGRYGQRAGAILAAETGQESGPELAKLLAAMEPGAIGVDFDPGNLIVSGYSPQEALEALGPSILHVHLSDARRDTAWGRGQLVGLGEGSADLPALLGALEARDYRGWLTLRTPESANPSEAVSQAVGYMRRL